MLIRARMRTGGPFVDVCVRNISSRGMLLHAHEAPPPGTYVEIALPEDVIVGRVMWAADRRFGIRTRERLPLTRLAGLSKTGGQPVAAPAMRRGQRVAAQRHGDARLTGRSLQFLFLIAAMATMCAVAANIAYQMLAEMTDQVSEYL